MSSVTVPGIDHSIITVPTSPTFEHFIARQIADLLAQVSNLAVTNVDSGGTIPPSTPGATNELVVTGGGGANSVPAGYDFIVNDDSSPDSISGVNTAILSGSVGGTFWVSGNSTVAAGDGSNIIVGQSGGTYLLGGGIGNDSIFSSGGGTIGGSTGANLLWAADGSDTMPNLIISDGTGDTIAAGPGADTVAAYGSNDLIFGGSGSLLVGMAPNSTVSSGTGPETIWGASGALVYGNQSSGITFVGGAGPATVFGSTTTVTTIFGGSGSGSDMNFVNTATAGGIMAAYVGNNTLNSALSSSNNTLAGGTGNDSLVGGSGNDVLWAGTGADTMTGGAGSNLFNFVNGHAGGADVITDFNASDAVNLVGYGANAAAQAIAAETIAGGATTIQLSDSTRITFVGVNGLNTSNVHS